MINIVWVIFGIVNVLFLVHFCIGEVKRGSKINYGWFTFFTFFALYLGPVWTLFLVIYKVGDKYYGKI